MAAQLPYVASPGSITNALEKIKAAAKPSRFTNDFVHTKLQIKGGTGKAIAPFLKKLGLIASDGTPTSLYDSFRNSSTSGAAIADALRIGYKALFEVNEYAYELSDKDLKGLILQVTGREERDKVVGLIVNSFKKLRSLANFEAEGEGQVTADEEPGQQGAHPERLGIERRASKGLNLSYTINLNLPATTNVEVFNAIFKSLKDHLLRDD